MKVLFAASEIAPWVKTGGLGDVAGVLPGALGAAGVDVRVLVPAYPALKAAFPHAREVARAHWLGGLLPVPTLLQAQAPDGTIESACVDNDRALRAFLAGSKRAPEKR